MKLLILGNTAFLGRAIVEEALERGHQVVVLNRTALDRSRLTSVEWIDGTVETALERVAGRQFDAVIDLSAAKSATTLRTALMLSDRVGHYTLVSSISVYRDFATPGMDETYPTAQLPISPAGGSPERVDDYGTYGARLALCEGRVAEAMPGKALVVRAGLMTGPYDCTDRVTRLIRRVALGGEVLAGSSPAQPVQLLDVRDMAMFLLARAESQAPGLLNCTGPDTTLGEVMETTAAITNAGASFFYTSDDFIARQGISPLSQLPLWIPQKTYGGFFKIDNHRARALGLAARPLSQTLADTLTYLREQDESGANLQIPANARPAPISLPRGAEQRLIEDYKRQSNGKHAAVA